MISVEDVLPASGRKLMRQSSRTRRRCPEGRAKSAGASKTGRTTTRARAHRHVRGVSPANELRRRVA